jgi:hypothetical protein
MSHTDEGVRSMAGGDSFERCRYRGRCRSRKPPPSRSASDHPPLAGDEDSGHRPAPYRNIHPANSARALSPGTAHSTPRSDERQIAPSSSHRATCHSSGTRSRVFPSQTSLPSSAESQRETQSPDRRRLVNDGLLYPSRSRQLLAFRGRPIRPSSTRPITRALEPLRPRQNHAGRKKAIVPTIPVATAPINVDPP